MNQYKEIGYNKKAGYDYEIIEKFEAGIILEGSEVKFLRTQKVNGDTLHLAEAYAGFSRSNELFLYQMNIPKYSLSNIRNHDPKRVRKLLLHRRQINRILGQLKIKGLTMIPLGLHFSSNGHVKVTLGIGKGKKSYDKRAAIKEREWNREKHRVLKNSNRF